MTSKDEVKAPRLPWKVRKLDETIWADITDGDVSEVVTAEEDEKDVLKRTHVSDYSFSGNSIGRYVDEDKYYIRQHARIDHLPPPVQLQWYDFGVAKAAAGLKNDLNDLEDFKSDPQGYLHGNDCFYCTNFDCEDRFDTTSYLEGKKEEIDSWKGVIKERLKKRKAFARQEGIDTQDNMLDLLGGVKA